MKIEHPRCTRELTMRSWLLREDCSLILVMASARDEGAACLCT